MPLFLAAKTASAIDCTTVSCTKLTCSPGSGFCTYRYGPSRASSYYNQEADIYLPTGFDTATSAVPIVVLVHGGYWYDSYLRASTNGSDMRPLAEDLQDRGYVVVNLEYRRAANSYVGGIGGFPDTFNDLIDGIDALACVKDSNTCSITSSTNMDTSKVVAAGHSAGGHLALWRALQSGLTSTIRGAYGINSASIELVAAIGLAAVSNFEGPCTGDGSANSGAIANFMSYGTNAISSYCSNHIDAVVSPYHMLENANAQFTSTFPIKLVHGTGDTTVRIIQSESFDTGTNSLANIDGQPGYESGSHFNVIDPDNALWSTQAIGFIESVIPLSTLAPSTSPTHAPTTGPTKVSFLGEPYMIEITHIESVFVFMRYGMYTFNAFP